MNRFVTRLRAWPVALLVAGFFLLLRSSAADDGWVNLFNGKNLDGWVQRGGQAKYSAEDGVILGRAVPNTPNSFLCTTKDYKDFVLELEFNVDNGLNSGVQIRSEYTEQPKILMVDGKRIKIEANRVYGYQVEIDPDKPERRWTGGIYDEGRRKVFLYDLSKNEAARKAFKPGEWNKFRIECKGDSLKTWINGVPAADIKDSVAPAGFIGLQVHGIGKKTTPLAARFRNIRIKELK